MSNSLEMRLLFAILLGASFSSACKKTYDGESWGNSTRPMFEWLTNRRKKCSDTCGTAPEVRDFLAFRTSWWCLESPSK